MKPTHHAIISGITGASLAYFLNSWICGISCFLSGVLIDLDHIIDYLIEKKRFPLTYRELSHYCSFDRKGKLFLVFHGLEYMIILLFFLFKYPNDIFLGIFLGMGLHILCDQFSNPIRPLGYFFVYRMKNNFDRKYIFTKQYAHEILQLF